MSTSSPPGSGPTVASAVLVVAVLAVVVLAFALVYLTTEISNFRALRLFRKLGFKTTSSYGDEVEMKLTIASAMSEPQAA